MSNKLQEETLKESGTKPSYEGPNTRQAVYYRLSLIADGM
jgi:hypothetical protein